MRICMHNNENGMVLVLAMFMLALLSMIGVASMMTTTTDIEIATGERQYVETFYRAQASHTIAGEMLQLALFDRGLEGETTTDTDGIDAYNYYETFDTNGDPAYFEDIDDYTFAFRLIDPKVFQENFEGVGETKTWNADEQTVDELPCPQDMTASECTALNVKIGTTELDLWTDMQIVRGQGEEQIVLADIDIDKIKSEPMPGMGAEFGGKDLGMGSNTAIITYNLDARARLSSGTFNKSPSRQAMGFRIVK